MLGFITQNIFQAHAFSVHNGILCFHRITPSDVAELRNLIMTCASLTREQSQEAVAHTRALTHKLDKAQHQITQLSKQYVILSFVCFVSLPMMKCSERFIILIHTVIPIVSYCQITILFR